MIQRHIAKIQKAESQLGRVARRAILDNKPFILSLLKHEQLGQGLDSSGQVVGEYAPSTSEWAKRPPRARTSKTAGQPYNFEWTGTFFDTMRIKTDSEGYDILSARKDFLEHIYKVRLTKFTQENSDLIDEKIVKPALRKFMLDNIAFN